MAATKLSYINHCDAATSLLSASNTAGSLSPQNLADTRPLKRWRTTSLTAWAQVDFGMNVDIDVLALVFARDQTLPGGNVTHTLDADGGTAGAGVAHNSGSISIGLTDGYGYHVHLPGSTISARYWRWTYALSGPTYVDTGRAWAGELWQPTYNFDMGNTDRWTDASAKLRAARSGSTFVEELPRFREVSFGFTTVPEADRPTHRELQRYVGKSKQCLMLIDPDTPSTETILGRLNDVPGTRHRRNAFKTFEAHYTLMEF